MLLLLTVVGCMETVFPISGPVTDSRYGGNPIPDADVTLRDAGGQVFSQATTNDYGWFEADMPPQQIFYMHATADGFVDTSYSGLSAAAPFEIIEGEVWLRSTEDLEDIRAEFDGCAPDTLGEGGVIEGEVRLYVLPGQDPDELPLVTTATITAYTVDGAVTAGCYLNDKGESAPDQGITGQTGRFALFNVPSGTISINVQYDYGGPEPREDWYVVYVPESGVVPLYPVYSSMPM